MGRPSLPEENKIVGLQVLRGQKPWVEWVNGLAEHDGERLAEMVDKALQGYAKKVGYKAPHPGRLYKAGE